MFGKEKQKKQVNVLWAINRKKKKTEKYPGEKDVRRSKKWQGSVPMREVAKWMAPALSQNSKLQWYSELCGEFSFSGAPRARENRT